MINLKKYKEVGIINEEVCNLCSNSQYLNFKIYESKGLIHHAEKHKNNFNTIGSFYKSIASIPLIIKRPYFVYYDKQKNSFRYYKKIYQYVCVVINIKDNYAYISTIYPVNKKTVYKLKKEREINPIMC